MQNELINALYLCKGKYMLSVLDLVRSAKRAINPSLLGDVVGEGARIRERRALEWHLSRAWLRSLGQGGLRGASFA